MPLLCIYYDSFSTSIVIGIVLLRQRKPVPLFQKEIKDYSYSYIILMYGNMNPFSSFYVTNLLIYDQHLLEFFLNESISMENRTSCELVKVKDFQANLWLVKEPCMQTIRYQRKSILASKGTSLFMNKWKCYLVTFWQWHFSLWFHPRRIYINQLANHSLSFLGYLSSVRMNPSVVRSQILENAFLINNAIKKFDTLVPIIPLIASLAKAKFCNVLGHPISKPVRADLSDSNIIDRFGRICRNLSHYHSGSSTKKSLYRIKYILRLSCARTLARKHKSTVRAFEKIRLGIIGRISYVGRRRSFFDLPKSFFNFAGSI